MKKKTKKFYILSFIASICFFLTYFVTKETINFILGLTWSLIGITYKKEYKNI